MKANTMNDTNATEKLLSVLSALPGDTLRRPEVWYAAEAAKIPNREIYAFLENPANKIRHGVYRKPGSSAVPTPVAPVVAPVQEQTMTPMSSVSVTDTPVANTSIQAEASKLLGTSVIASTADSIPNIPAKLRGYVQWGNFETVSKVVESKHFLPVMIVGPSGNGKTEMVEQVCANSRREFVRLNITNQTDEFDLIGGFQLVNGDTKFALGPVPMAMLAGAVLLLDEIDLGGAALMCLQPVLEGKPLYIKKIGKYIHPKAGFTVVATANTKGRGDDGKYAHTTMMNEAMLERFAVMFEQGWPDAATERRILSYVMKQEGCFDTTLVANLVQFANLTRKSYAQQTVSSEIATRRLLHIVRTFCALRDINLVMKLTMARFDATEAESFMKIWESINVTPADATGASGAPVAETDIPF